MVIYGRSGTGKTTLASTMPGPVLLLDVRDRGTDSVSDVPDGKELSIDTWDDFEDTYWALTREHGYKSVIIDTVSQLQDLAIKAITGNKSMKKEAGEWGSMTKQDWGEVASLLKVWLIRFRDLPMDVAFIAQDRVFNVDEDEDNGIAPEVGPRIMPSVASVLNAGVDIIVNTFTREDVRIKLVNGKKKEVKRIDFCARVGPSASYVTKIRKPRKIEIPPYLVDPTYDDLLSLIRGEE